MSVITGSGSTRTRLHSAACHVFFAAAAAEAAEAAAAAAAAVMRCCCPLGMINPEELNIEREEGKKMGESDEREKRAKMASRMQVYSPESLLFTSAHQTMLASV